MNPPDCPNCQTSRAVAKWTHRAYFCLRCALRQIDQELRAAYCRDGSIRAMGYWLSAPKPTLEQRQEKLA